MDSERIYTSGLPVVPPREKHWPGTTNINNWCQRPYLSQPHCANRQPRHRIQNGRQLLQITPKPPQTLNIPQTHSQSIWDDRRKFQKFRFFNLKSDLQTTSRGRQSLPPDVPRPRKVRRKPPPTTATHSQTAARCPKSRQNHPKHFPNPSPIDLGRSQKILKFSIFSTQNPTSRSAFQLAVCQLG